MMNKCFMITVFFGIIILCSAIDLPSYFKKCSRTDPNLSECIHKNINSSLKLFVKGDEKYHLHSLDPLLVPYMHVKVDETLFGNLTEGIVDGFADSICKHVKVDLDERTFEFLSFSRFISVTGKFELSGKLLSLSIGGTGKTNVTFVNCLQRVYFKYDLVERKGNKYMVINNCTLENINVDKIYFDVDFDNNNFGPTINKVLNDNWREVREYVSTSVNMAFAEVFKSVFNSFFARIPYENFFSE